MNYFKPQITRDILLLIDIKVPLHVVRKWTRKQVLKIDEYASAVHFTASDNEGIKIPPIPIVLKPWIKTKEVENETT